MWETDEGTLLDFLDKEEQALIEPTLKQKSDVVKEWVRQFPCLVLPGEG
ncbi:hypothetical protein [Ectobacillus ponti]|uniref:Uncharacterized protein n=1 Tax=Ectobacillus ponti TaxID=2961894 RepID=A0AA41X8P9_9BACI|nr:hypothetical protein [Ectobacillus ponti]MCP8970956.1 hypothetical protein [Ectobacillus ponti]